MQIDADDVEAQLDKLMIYEKGGSFKCNKRPVADAGKNKVSFLNC